MDHATRRTRQQIISHLQDWIKSLSQQSAELHTSADAANFEQRFRDEGLQMLGSVFQELLQNALDHQEENRTCPKCGRRRRHKGCRERNLLSSVGAIRLSGTYWYCSDCGGQHAADMLAPESSTRPMQQLLCLLGTSMASFAKASFAGKKLLGVRVSDATIRRLCYQHGRKVPIAPVPVEPTKDLVGSCDGTMVNTRQTGWRELKAYQFRYDSNKHGRAYLEPSKYFVPRLRKAAIALKAGDAGRIFWVSDAAEWIDKGVQKQLPMAFRIIDIWHAWQHIHEASRDIYPDDEDKARRWAERYCEVLEDSGGCALYRKLRHARYVQAKRQQAVEKLRSYLLKNASRMEYPEYKREGYPISSGPMESFCKQLGQRLKGPGMRWDMGNVSFMANMVSLWANEEWDRHWKTVA
jgi:ribosomal protein L37AE/L43A